MYFLQAERSPKGRAKVALNPKQLAHAQVRFAERSGEITVRMRQDSSEVAVIGVDGRCDCARFTRQGTCLHVQLAAAHLVAPEQFRED